MSKLDDFIALANAALGRTRGAQMLAVDDNGDAAAVRADASGAVRIVGDVDVDTSDLATQATLAAVLALLQTPTKHTAIVKSDDTDLTAIANFGVYVGGDGDLAYRTSGTSGTTVTLPVSKGQLVYGAFTRVMAATTATNLVGVSR